MNELCLFMGGKLAECFDPEDPSVEDEVGMLSSVFAVAMDSAGEQNLFDYLGERQRLLFAAWKFLVRMADGSHALSHYLHHSNCRWDAIAVEALRECGLVRHSELLAEAVGLIPGRMEGDPHVDPGLLDDVGARMSREHEGLDWGAVLLEFMIRNRPELVAPTF